MHSDALPRYEVLQPNYNLVDRAGYEAELEPLCRAEGVGVIPYYSLAAGFLSGKYRTEADLAKSTRGAKVKKSYFNDRGFKVLAAVDAAVMQCKVTFLKDGSPLGEPLAVPFIHDC